MGCNISHVVEKVLSVIRRTKQQSKTSANPEGQVTQCLSIIIVRAHATQTAEGAREHQDKNANPSKSPFQLVHVLNVGRLRHYGVLVLRGRQVRTHRRRQLQQCHLGAGVVDDPLVHLKGRVNEAAAPEQRVISHQKGDRRARDHVSLRAGQTQTTKKNEKMEMNAFERNGI